eukprot:73836-Hanusia_phi.AAC.1
MLCYQDRGNAAHWKRSARRPVLLARISLATPSISSPHYVLCIKLTLQVGFNQLQRSTQLSKGMGDFKSYKTTGNRKQPDR